jgi:hypothetical protein
MANRLAYVCDKHIDSDNLLDTLPNGAPVIDAADNVPRLKYRGVHPEDEDRSHVLQLTFERDATLLTADRRMIQKARNFGPCGSHKYQLGGVIVLPVGKAQQLKSLETIWDGVFPELGDGRAAFRRIWQDNRGIDLTVKRPEPVELCDCPWGDDKERHRRRYKRK